MCKTVKMTKIGKMTIFGQNIFHRKSNFTIKIGFRHDPVRLLWAPWDIYTRIPGRYFQKVDNPSIWYGPVVRNFWPKNRPKNRHFSGSRWQKLHFFTKNGRNVTWMGSNGYIMHITYLNYVDISPAEPEKIVLHTLKIDFFGSAGEIST